MPVRTCRATRSKLTQVRKAWLSLTLAAFVSVAAVLAVVSTLHDRVSPDDWIDFFFAALFSSASCIAFAISFVCPSCQSSASSLEHKCSEFELSIILNRLCGSPHPGLRQTPREEERL